MYQNSCVTCTGVIVVCNAVLGFNDDVLLRSGDIRDQVAKFSEIDSKF